MKTNSAQKLTKKQASWLEHIQQCQASSETLSAYAAQHGLSRQRLY